MKQSPLIKDKDIAILIQKIKEITGTGTIVSFKLEKSGQRIYNIAPSIKETLTGETEEDNKLKPKKNLDFKEDSKAPNYFG